jgi:hypothetical protein
MSGSRAGYCSVTGRQVKNQPKLWVKFCILESRGGKENALDFRERREQATLHSI